jgi:hypothetical protein
MSTPDHESLITGFYFTSDGEEEVVLSHIVLVDRMQFFFSNHYQKGELISTLFSINFR